MAIDWILPALKEAYKHKDAAFNTWDAMLSALLGPKSKIAFVGHGGIGKSVLLDYVSGKANKKDYKLPARSTTADRGGAKSEGYRLAITVSPGQGGPKVDSFNKIFDPQNAVDGIVFVAGSGYVTLRDEDSMEAMITKGFDSIAKWRGLNIREELEYLKDVCTHIRATKKKTRDIKWMLCAVTKADLFYDEITDVQKYYSPHSDSDFSSCLHELTMQVGSDNFEWDALPVCSHLENFPWGTSVQESRLGDEERDHYLAQFITRLGELSR